MTTMTGSKLLTHSRLSTFRECGRKHDLKYRQGFRPVREEEALRLGSLIHVGLEAWWKAQQTGDDRLEAALAAVRAERMEPFDVPRIETLLAGYEARWGGDMSDFDEVVAVEKEFTAPLLNPETWHPSNTYELGGKVDLIGRKAGRVRIGEHKTTSERIDSDDDHYWQKLAMDHQLSIYVVGAETLGFKVDECVYDVIRKPLLRPYIETPDEKKKYTKEGKLYANQHASDETPDEFGARLAEEVNGNLNAYYQRRVVPRMNSQIEDFLADTWATARNIREQELAGRAPRNPDACWRFGGCAFWNVCANGENINESAAFVKVENVHPELTQREVANGDAERRITTVVPITAG
jgi:hypothetical protein